MTHGDKPPTLFKDFPGISTKQWHATVQRDLKGADPESLLWQTGEGFAVKAFYRAEDLAGLTPRSPLPGVFPFVRGRKTGHNRWLNLQDITVTDNGQQAIDQAVAALRQGADGIHFLIQDPSTFRLGYLLRQINLSQTPVCYTLPEPGTNFVRSLLSRMKENRLPGNALAGFVHHEAGPNLALALEKPQLKILASLLEQTQHATDFRALTVSGASFRNQGCSATQEIAFTLSLTVHYLHKLTDLGMSLDAVVRNLQLLVSAGTDYFMELAKFRALRLLWSLVLQAYKAESLAGRLRVHATTTTWHQTLFDPHNNLLRATTGAMSAILGGCDSLSVVPFDQAYQTPDAFSQRLARNIPLLLREESFLDKTVDPAAGSFYLEHLTDQLAQKAWALFQEIEARGGFRKAAQEGFIANQITTVSRQKHHDIASGQKVVVGTNRFPNLQEHLPMEPEALLQGTALDTTRGSYPFEVMRLAAELHQRKRKQKPLVTIAILGDEIERHVHATFAQEFFSCANFETKVQTFATVDAAAAVLLQHPAKVVVLSASPTDFAQFGQQVAPQLQKHPSPPVLVLASDPDVMREEMIASGFDEFLFHGCDPQTIITRIQEKLLKDGE